MYQHRRRDSTASAAPSSPGKVVRSERYSASGSQAVHRSVYALARLR